MSGRHVSMQCGYWSDPDMAGWGPLAKLYYLYLWTNSDVHGLTGVGRISSCVMAAATGMSARQMETARGTIGERVAWYEDGTYWVRGRAAHTCYTTDGRTNPKLAQAVRTWWAQSRGQVKADFAERYPGLVSETGGLGDWETVGHGDGERRAVVDRPAPRRRRVVGGGVGWTAEETALVIAAAPVEWRDELMRRTRALWRTTPPMALGLILEAQRNGNRPTTLEAAMRRIFGLIRTGCDPSAENYNEAKRRLKAGAERRTA